MTNHLHSPSAAVGVVLCLALTSAACAPSKKAAPSTTTSVPPTTATTRPSAPAGTNVPSDFEPGSVTFVSSSTGFVIGVDSSCAVGACVALARTTDGGSSWVALPAPDAGYESRNNQRSTSVPAVSEVRFADELDGWIYGPSLFATHDGGATWQPVSIGASVVSLETSGGYVDALVSPCTGVQGQECTGSLQLYQAQATGGGFSPLLTGPSVSSSVGVLLHLSLHAPVGFVNMTGVGEPNQAVIYATQNLANPSGWKAFPEPCARLTNYFFDAFVAPDSTSLYTLCSGEGAAGSVTKAVVKTVSGVNAVTGTPPPGGDPEALAATSAGTLVVSAASGASWLYQSTDGGVTWTTAGTFNDGGVGFNDLGFTTSTQGMVIHGVAGPPTNVVSQLLMTTDAGASWSVVPIG